MTFTVEKEETKYDTRPVDLFFIFDASASQDSQISEMIKSAEGIVKLFAARSED